MPGIAERAEPNYIVTRLPVVWLYLLAALFEIAGCYAIWAWLRLGYSPLLLLPAIILLLGFAMILTQVDSTHAGRAYAAYGGIYVAASLFWLALVEQQMPDRWDLIGGTVVIIGALIIILGPRVDLLNP